MKFDPYLVAVFLGVWFGVLARLVILKSDYRQYPTYPHGYVIHLSLGLIAAALGAVAVPALLKKDFTAVTFLTLAAQQFRDVRNMERETLSKLDDMELVPRGGSYIEGIAMVFEGRNYLVMFTSFLISLTFVLTREWTWTLLLGIGILITSYFLKTGRVISDIAKVTEAKLRFVGPNLYVDNIYLMNIGLKENRKNIIDQGVGIILEPKNASSRISLSNVGQRQAILHEASVVLGVFRDTGEPALVPIAKRDLSDGRLGILLVLQDDHREKAIEIVKRVPVLESSIRKPDQF